MQQSNIIFGALLIAYILYITNKGELGTYIALLRGGGQEQNNSSSNSSSSGIGGLTGLSGLGGNITSDSSSITSGGDQLSFN